MRLGAPAPGGRPAASPMRSGVGGDIPEDGAGLRRCERFRRDGSACATRPVHLNGWCRQPDCDGFLRHVPESIGAPSGTRAHLRRTGAAVAELDSDQACSVDMTCRAIESLRFHHGGTEAAAEIELRCMLEDFVRLSARQEAPTGFIRLSRSGGLT